MSHSSLRSQPWGPAMLDELPISDASLHTAQGNANEYDSRVLAFSPNFGRIFRAAEAARQMQFGMKVIF